jgi:hypothetical protein
MTITYRAWAGLSPAKGGGSAYGMTSPAKMIFSEVSNFSLDNFILAFY